MALGAFLHWAVRCVVLDQNIDGVVSNMTVLYLALTYIHLPQRGLDSYQIMESGSYARKVGRQRCQPRKWERLSHTTPRSSNIKTLDKD